MSDRHCIHKNGELFHFSTEDINSCDEGVFNAGCDGGNPDSAMDYWKSQGDAMCMIIVGKYACIDL